jgi:hypothetical protein
MILRSLLLVGAVCVAAPAFAADKENRFAPHGVGLVTCEQFLKGVEERKENWLVVGGWLEGYMSAINQLSPDTFDIAPWQSTESLVALIRHNCENNKERRFFDIVSSMMNFLKDKRLKESTQRIIAESGDKKLAVYTSVMKDVQDELIKRKILQGTADGQFGPKTKAALEQFQKEQNIEATGLPDQQTLWRLLAQSQDKKPEPKKTGG